MDITYELDKYKGFYRMYKEIMNSLDGNYDYDVCVDNVSINDNNSKVSIKIYKSDYNYVPREELNRLYNNNELFIYTNSVVLSDYLAFNLVNIIRDSFINRHDILLPCFDKYGNQVLKSKSNTMHVSINTKEDFRAANDIQNDIIRRKTKN